MKLTGIVRKIDNLGRIVIPKEIRNRLNIDDNDDIEIFVEDNAIILRKYSLMSEMHSLIATLSKTISKITSNNIFVTDKEKIIYSNKQEFKNIQISVNLKKIINNNKNIDEYCELKISESIKIESYFYTSLILCNGYKYGMIIMYSKSKIDDDDKNMILFFSKILSKSFE